MNLLYPRQLRLRHRHFRRLPFLLQQIFNELPFGTTPQSRELVQLHETARRDPHIQTFVTWIVVFLPRCLCLAFLGYRCAASNRSGVCGSLGSFICDSCCVWARIWHDGTGNKGFFAQFWWLFCLLKRAYTASPGCIVRAACRLAYCSSSSILSQ